VSGVLVREGSGTLTKERIADFVAAWFRALDNHAPIEECYTLLAEKDLRMQFPDGDIRDQATFKQWYDRVTHLFFDENHNVVSAEPRISGDQAVVDVVVAWQASWWEPPAAKSKRTAMDATQRWTVRRTDRNPYGLEIVSYNATVEPFKYAPGFAHL